MFVGDKGGVIGGNDVVRRVGGMEYVWEGILGELVDSWGGKRRRIFWVGSNGDGEWGKKRR